MGATARPREGGYALIFRPATIRLVASDRASSTTRKPRRSLQWWVTTKGSIAALDAIDPETTRAIFGRPTSVALGGWPGATMGQAWAAYRRFKGDARSGAIPPQVRVVMYDPEGWQETPLWERRRPKRFIRKFARLGHRRGYFVIVTPHPGLVDVPGTRFRRAAGETREEAYLRSGITFTAANRADACEIQVQHFERHPRMYRELVSQAAEQARAANPEVVFLSGLSTHPGYDATWEMLLAAWESVLDIVDGHYLSLARLRHPKAAARFLRETFRLLPPPDSPPVALLSVAPPSGPTPLAVTANASASTDTDLTPIGSYLFDFGDGSPKVGPRPNGIATHTYSSPGDYTVTVIVTDTAGHTSHATAQVQVS
jgi:hypothetical protein